MNHPRLIFFLGALLFALISGSACSTKQTDKQAQWKVIVPQTVYAEKLRFAAFLNDTFGLNGGAGDVGKARFTLDGGKSWIQAESSGG